MMSKIRKRKKETAMRLTKTIFPRISRTSTIGGGSETSISQRMSSAWLTSTSPGAVRTSSASSHSTSKMTGELLLTSERSSKESTGRSKTMRFGKEASMVSFWPSGDRSRTSHLENGLTLSSCSQSSEIL